MEGKKYTMPEPRWMRALVLHALENATKEDEKALSYDALRYLIMDVLTGDQLRNIAEIYFSPDGFEELEASK